MRFNYAAHLQFRSTRPARMTFALLRNLLVCCAAAKWCDATRLHRSA